MRSKGCFICSIVEYERTFYLRFLTTDSIEEYQQSLKTWYPKLEWVLENHRVWFHLTPIYKEIISKLESYIESLQVSSKMNFKKECYSDNGCCYACTNSGHVSIETIRSTVFEGIHGIVLDVLENDTSDEKDFMEELREHVYKGNCRLSFYDSADINEISKNDMGMPIYKPIDSNGQEYIFNVVCNDYIKDPWNLEYPIVWSSSALKDLIKYSQYAGIIGTNDRYISKDKETPPTDFWMVDDTLNIRSKSISQKLCKSDIYYLFSLIGDVPSFIYSSLQSNNYGSTFMPLNLDDYYTLILDKNEPTSMIPDGICSTLSHGSMFGHVSAELKNEAHWDQPNNKIYSASVVQKPLETTKPSTSVSKSNELFSYEKDADKNKEWFYVYVLNNHITRQIQCLFSSTVACNEMLLPEIDILQSVKVEREKDAFEIVKLFKERFYKEPSCYDIYLSKMLEGAYRYRYATLEKYNEVYREVVSSEETMDNIVSPNTACTVRSALEFLLKRYKLIPSTTWAPSSVVLDQLNKYIIALSKHTVFSTISCQKNQLSILLADIVPKKRFVSGQMFQMQPPNEYIVNNAIQELLKIYQKKPQIPKYVPFTPPVPKSTRTKIIPYQDIRSDVEINKIEPSPWGISTFEKKLENFQKLDLDAI